MVDHAPGVDQVERLVVERKVLGIRLPKVRRQIFPRETLARDVDCCFGDVHAGTVGTCPRPLKMIRAGTDADFKNALSAMAGELGVGVNERFESVASFLDSF